MTSDRKKPDAAFWATVSVTIVLLSAACVGAYTMIIRPGMTGWTSDAVVSPLGCEIFGMAIIGTSVLLAAFSIMQRLGLAPAGEADRGWWLIGVFAAVVFGIFGSLIVGLVWLSQ